MSAAISEEEGGLVAGVHTTVLLVGPNRENLSAMKQVLENADLEIIVASSFPDFEAIISTHAVDLTIIDAPRYHPQIFQQFHLLFDKGVPVILVANVLNPAHRTEALSHGCAEAFQKPIPVSLLRMVTASVLARCGKKLAESPGTHSEQDASPPSSTNSHVSSEEPN